MPKRSKPWKATSMIQVSVRDANLIIRSLGRLEEYLEICIDGEMCGNKEPSNPKGQAVVAMCRKRWREAEDLIMLLDAGGRVGAVKGERAIANRPQVNNLPHRREVR